MTANSRRSTGKPNPIPGSKPFQKGQSGNPSGRPKDYLTQALRQRVGPEDAKKLAETLLALALAGDMKALQEVFDRVEGKAIARQEQGRPGEFDGLSSLQELTTDELRSIVKLQDRKAS